MKKKDGEKIFAGLPGIVQEYIKQVLKGMRFHKKAKAETVAELAAHFEDELRECASEEEREKKAEKVIAEFGDAKMLGTLIRRGKKRCRPMWKKVIIWGFQTIGVALVCLVLYCIYLAMGKPTISVNYVQKAYELVRPTADESLNAALLYQKAFGLYIKEPNIAEKKLLNAISDKNTPTELTEEELSLMKLWIADNSEALEMFKQATNKPYCWWKQEAKNNLLFSVALPELSTMRRLANLLCWRGKVAASEGQIDEAFDDVLTCYRAGIHCKGPRSLTEQIFGIGLEDLACNTNFLILQAKEIDSLKLQAFQNEFEKLIARDTFKINFMVEKFLEYDIIQRYFTDDGKGSGHYIPGVDHSALVDSNQLGIATYIKAMKIGLIVANRSETTEKFDKAYEQIEKWSKTTPWQRQQANIDTDSELGLNKKDPLEFWSHPYYYILMPAIIKVFEFSYRNKVQANALVTTIAIIRFKQDKGDYPEILDKLVEAGYLKELPMDAWSGKSLVYKKTKDGFTLYSVGQNFKDDGGEVFRDKDGKVKQWGDEGDTVFWPVE